MTAKPLFNRVCIVGVGLIGGSIGAAIKKRCLAKLVVGVVRRKSTIEEAFRKDALDVATENLKEGVKGADLVVLCAPVLRIVEQLKTIAPLLDSKTIVIDVGSSKTLIDRTAKKHLKKNVFVGCHPMAGSEKCGIGHADASLFQGAICFMTSKHPKVCDLWEALGAEPVAVTAHEHDEWVAKASHFSHVAAFAQFMMLENVSSRVLSRVAGSPNPSLRPAGRLAKSSPDLWAEILLSNGPQVVRSIEEAIGNLSAFKSAISRGDAAALRKFVRLANERSRRIVPDEP